MSKFQSLRLLMQKCSIQFFVIILFLIIKLCIDLEKNVGNFMIFEGDYGKLYPYYEHAQVSSGELAVICVIPFMLFVIQFGYTYYKIGQLDTDNEKNQLWNKLYISFYFLCFGYSCLFVTMMFTDLLKSVVSMPRPNFFHMCDFKKIRTDYAYYEANVKIGQVVDLNDCFASESDTEEAQLSFPSGHSSYSMSVALSYIPITIFSEHKPLPALITFGLFFLAIYTGVSRIMDYYHNVWDVLFGFFLAGCVTGTLFMIFYEDLLRIKNTNFFEKS